MRRVLGLLTLLLMLGADPLVSAAKEICGSLESLDVDNGSITVAVLGEAQPATFSLLKKDLPVTDTLGKVLRLQDLKSKHRLALALDEGKECVVAIRLESDCRWGLVHALAKDATELTIRFGAYPQKIPLQGDVRVLIEGKPARLGDLKLLQPVRLTYSADHRRLVQIEADRRLITVNPYCRPMVENGIVLKVDHARKKIEIVNSAERPRVEAFEYEPWTAVRLIYSSRPLRQVGMDALWPYARVVFNYESDLRRFGVINADVPRLVRRTMSKVDLVKRKLTLTSPEGKTEEFAIPQDVQVVRGEPPVPAGLDDLKEGGVVTAGLSPDGSEVLLLQLWTK